MIALMADNGRLFFYKGADLHTQYGYIKSGEIEKANPGKRLTTNTGKELIVIEASFLDLYSKIKRGAQIIPLKDMASIVTGTGMNKKSVVLEAGSGSGASSIFMAHIAKKVYTYELREDFYKIVEGNLEKLEIKNVYQKMGDIYLGIKEKNIDIILLDLPSPWKAIEHALKALKIGGYLVSYSPSIAQVSDFVDEIGKSDFVHLKTTETIEREWDVDGRKIRPKSQPIGHSGFLTFCRRL